MNYKVYDIPSYGIDMIEVEIRDIVVCLHRGDIQHDDSWDVKIRKTKSSSMTPLGNFDEKDDAILFAKAKCGPVKDIVLRKKLTAIMNDYDEASHLALTNFRISVSEKILDLLDQQIELRKS